MVCSFRRQMWPTMQGKAIESENGFYIIEYLCTDSCQTEPLAVDADGNDLLGQAFCAKGYKIPRDKLAQYDLKGHWEIDKNKRRSFVVEDYEEIHGTDEYSVIEFLKTRLPSIGAAKAKRLWDAFGAEVFDVLENHPEKLKGVKGIGEKEIPSIVGAYNEKKCIKEIQLLFTSLGLSRKIAERVYNEYGTNSEEMVTKHPYSLVGRFKGINFDVADKIALSNNLDYDSDERIQAAALEVLHQAEVGGELFRSTSGNLCVEGNEMLSKTYALLSRARTIDRGRITEVIKNGCVREKGSNRPPLFSIRIDRSNPKRPVSYVYTYRMDRLESELAFNMARLARRGFRNTFSVPDEIRLKELEEQIALAPEQRTAVEVGLSNGFAVITGGPGTGKTTILKFIRDIYKKRNKNAKMLLCSPTGVAATRMTASTGAAASTVHKALNLRPDDENGGVFGNVVELDYDFIVVDETSMLDIFLSGALLQSLKNGARLLFIGDIDQLPSVGPGAVLRDVIESGTVKVARLTKVYRQAEENKIAINAILTKNGKSSFDYKEGEFEFIPARSFAEARNIMEQLYMREIAANGIDNVMMLSPYRKRTESGVDSLNLMRDKINMPDKGKAELKVGEKLFRVGDKVINLKNNDIASNGETGMIIKIGAKVFVDSKGREENKKCITVDFGHDKRDYDMDDALEMLDWAYAMTVHKSQGSEAKVVILNLMDGHFNMLKRNLLYTAITRAKVCVYIVGQMSAIDTAVRSGISDEDRRKTMLALKIQKMLSLDDAGFAQMEKMFSKVS